MSQLLALLVLLLMAQYILKGKHLFFMGNVIDCLLTQGYNYSDPEYPRYLLPICRIRTRFS
jgi:hypothetical protein